MIPYEYGAMRETVYHSKMSPLVVVTLLLLLSVLFVVFVQYYKPQQISGFENIDPSNKSNHYTGPQSMSGANTTDTADQALLAAKGRPGAPTGANAGANLDSNYPR